jgi:hypothetical protein
MTVYLIIIDYIFAVIKVIKQLGTVSQRNDRY